jgi:hypothetical protein
LNARIWNHFISNSKFFDIKGSLVSYWKNILKRLAKPLWLNFTLNWSLYYVLAGYIPNIYIWEINNFVIKSYIFMGFFICKSILKKISCYHDNYFKYFMFGKYNDFVGKARVSACMYFLVIGYEVERDIENYQGRGLCYPSKPKAVAANTNRDLDNCHDITRKSGPIIILLITHQND